MIRIEKTNGFEMKIEVERRFDDYDIFTNILEQTIEQLVDDLHMFSGLENEEETRKEIVKSFEENLYNNLIDYFDDEDNFSDACEIFGYIDEEYDDFFEGEGEFDTTVSKEDLADEISMNLANRTYFEINFKEAN